MVNEYWKTKLTPSDAELFVMVESLLGKHCLPCSGGDHYFFEADYELHRDEPEYLLAVWDAIEGRLGERCIEIKDDADRHAFLVRARFSTEKLPGLVRAAECRKPEPSSGVLYCGKLEEVLAMQVQRDNADALIRFVGNGEMEIPDKGPAMFHFLNSGVVFIHALEGDYIVYQGHGRFSLVPRKQFERAYERK